MIYDIIKILKNCLKWWFVFLLTLAVGGATMFLSYKTSKTYYTSFDCEINCVNKQLIITEKNDIAYYNFLNGQVLDVVWNYYVDNNIEEIKENFNITDDDLVIDVNSYNLSTHSIIQMYINYSNKDLVEKINDYVKVDIETYAKEIALTTIPVDYQIDTNITIYKTAEVKTEASDLTNIIIITLLLLVIEVFIIGVVTLTKNKFWFDNEVETVLNKEILMIDYNENPSELLVRINKNNELLKSTLVFAEDKKHFDNILDKYKMDFVDINEDNLIGNIKDNKLVYESAIIELVKKNTSINKVNEIIEVLKSRNINNIYFITREMEKKKK